MDRGSAAIYPIWTMLIETVKVFSFLQLLPFPHPSTSYNNNNPQRINIRPLVVIYLLSTMLLMQIVVFLALADVTVSAYKPSVEILKISLGEMPAITGAIVVSLIFQAACGFPVYNVITELEQIIYSSSDEQNIYRPYRAQNVCHDLLVCALSPLQFIASAGEFLFTAPSKFYTGFAAYCARTVLHVTVICIIIDQLGKWEI